MKKMILIMSIICICIAFLIIFINNNNKKMREIKYSYDSVILSISNPMPDNSKFLEIIDGRNYIKAFGNDYYLIMIEGYTGFDGKSHITMSKRISNKKYQKILNDINSVNHYYEQIKTPYYIVRFKEELFFIIIDDIKWKLSI